MTITVVLTSGTAWTLPSDADVSGNMTVRAIGGGAAGRSIAATNTGTAGGGGGAYAEAVFSLSGLTPGSSSFSTQVGAAGTAGTNNATDTWFNKTTNAAPSTTTDGVLAKAGQLGVDDLTGGVGGLATGSVGTTKNNGGSGGARTTSGTSTGGGGAGGSTGAGGNASGTANVTGGVGGTPNGGTAGAASGGAGGAGTNWTTAGSGGGGAGRTSNGTGGAGGNYGAGGGGGRGTSGTGGAGAPGVLIITYDNVRQARRFRLDFNNLSTLWQDSAKTTPCTAAGDPIGYVADALGSGVDFRQTTSTMRPILRLDATKSRYYAEFDGTDDHFTSVNTTLSVNLDEFAIFGALQDTATTQNRRAISARSSGATNDYDNPNSLIFYFEVTPTNGIRIQNDLNNATGISAIKASTRPCPFAVYEAYKTATSASTLIDGVAGTADTNLSVPDLTNAGGVLIGSAWTGGTNNERMQGRIYSLEFNGTSGLTSGDRSTLRTAHSTGTFTTATTLAAATGSYSLTGTAATLRKQNRLPAAPGSYTLTGTSVGFQRGKTVVVSPGSYALTGVTVAVRVARRLLASAGSYALTGTSATLVPPSSGLIEAEPTPNHTTFASYTSGTGVPAGWTEAFTTGGTWQVVTDGAALGGKRLNLTGATNDRRFIYLNAAGDQTDVDIYFHCRFTTGNQVGTRCRINDLSSTSEDGLYIYLTDNLFEIGELTNSTSSSVAFDTSSLTAGTYYWVRWQTIGTVSRAKVWSGNPESEPSSWTISGTVASHTGAGKLGIGSRSSTNGFDIDWFDWAPRRRAAFASTSISRLDADIDSGSIDEFNSYMSGAAGSTPALTLHGRDQQADNMDPMRWWQYGFRLIRVNSKTPTFHVLLTSPTSVLASNMAPNVGGWVYKPWFSYDRITWTRFANYSTTAGSFQDFSHSSAFTSDIVYVRFAPEFSVGLTTQKVASLASNSKVSATTSWDGVSSTGAGKFRVGQTATFTDDLARTVPAQPLYGFKISDASLSMSNGTPKRKILVVSGIHPTEHEGPHVMWGLVEFLLSGASAANEALKRADFYVYPCGNPAGYFAGYWRQADNSQRDSNRHWNDTTLDFVVKLKAAIIADTGGSVAMSIDFHSSSLVDPRFCLVDASKIGTGLIATAWETAVRNAETAIGGTARFVAHDWTYNGESGVPPGSTEGWAAANLSPYLSVTSEVGISYNETLADYKSYGEAQARAIVSMYDSAWLGSIGGALSITAAPGSYTLTGVNAVSRAARRITAATGSYTVTGTSVGLAAARRLVTASGAYALTGTAAVLRAARRIVAAPASYALTGVTTGIVVGRRITAAAGTYTLTGTAATLAAFRRLVAGAGAYALTGTAAVLRRGKVVLAAPGSYVLSGVAAVLRATRVLAAASGSYALSGTAAVLRPSRAIVAASGSYTLAGTAAVLSAFRRLSAGAGSYALTGVAAGVYKGFRLIAQAGSYSLSGTAVTFRRTLALGATPGSYLLSGTAVSMTQGNNRILQAVPGSYALTGAAAVLRRALRMAAGAGAYSITGTAAAPSVGRRLIAAAGAYTLSGTAVGLLYGAASRLLAGVGSYALTGTTAVLRAVRRLSAAPGVYSLAGVTVSFGGGQSFILAAAAGAYAISGVAVTGRSARRLVAGIGSYAVSGIASVLRLTRRMVAEPGVLSLIGQPVAGGFARRLIVAPGAYAYAGLDLAQRQVRTMPAAAGVYTLQGYAVTFRTTARRPLTPESALYRGRASGATYSGRGGTTTFRGSGGQRGYRA